MTNAEIRAGIASRKWYHSITLAPGLVTPGHEWGPPIWDNIRHGMAALDYIGRSVLDLATFDGLWAFEAEKLGASMVVATDCIGLMPFENFLFAREALKSKVIPFYNVSPYHLKDRLDTIFDETHKRFDIVQHLGLLYHVRDPMWTLSQCRAVMHPNSILLLETAYWVTEHSGMIFNGNNGRIYDDCTTWWAPSLNCLKEMLLLSYLEPFGQICILEQDRDIGRVCMTARAIETIKAPNTPEWFDSYVKSTSKNPGVTL